MQLANRHWVSGDRYRFGFNGKESDDEWNGDGNMYNYGFRIHDPRLGRFLSVDPLKAQYPMLSTYQYASNSPICMIDVDGLEGTPAYNVDVFFGWVIDQFRMEVRSDLEATISKITDADTYLEPIHVGLDALGCALIAGEVADGLNGAIYLLEGEYVNAGISAIAMIPIVGDFGKAGKYISKTLMYVPTEGVGLAWKRLGKTADELYSIAYKGRIGLKKAMEAQGAKLIGQAHHILPLDLIKKNKYIKELYESGWDINKKINGIDLPAPFHTNHPAYTKFVNGQIETWIKKNGPENLQDFLEKKLIPKLENGIKEMHEAYKKDPSVGNLNKQFKKLLN